MSPATAAHQDRSFFGHPRGLATLFFTEMWERFSFYGIRAIIILFMTAAVTQGGLGFPVERASALVATFLSSVYLASLLGGWMADRILGTRQAVLFGGIGIALGNVLFCVPNLIALYIGMASIALGTGLLKTNASVMVGSLYAPDDRRRDAGFSIYYMGINTGSFLAPLICGYIGQRIDFRAGFAAAAAAMTLGLIQYVLSRGHFGPATDAPSDPAERSKALRQLGIGGGAFAALVLALIALNASGMMTITVESIANAFGLILIAIVVGVFGFLLAGKGWTSDERKKLWAIFGLFCASTIFWSLFEQAASTLTLFADRDTENRLLGIEFPSSYFQSFNPIFIIVFAPVFAWLWLKLGKREPSVPVKFALGLLGAALGYAVLIPAAEMVAGGNKAPAIFLTLTYLIHTFGELCLSPVGLSAMTRLAPARVGGFIMGVFFLSISAGNYLAGRVSGLYASMSTTQLFTAVTIVGLVAAALMFVAKGPLERMSAGDGAKVS